MNEMETVLVDQFKALLDTLVSPAEIRAAEAMDGVHPMWAEIESSGYLDLLCSESAGGAGLGFDSLFPLLVAAGERALPVPFGETAVARAMLAGSGHAIPEGAVIVLAPSSTVIPFAAVATHAFVEKDGSVELKTIDESGIDPFNVAGDSGAKLSGEAIATAPAPEAGLLACAAAITAAYMAGCMIEIQDMAITHVRERQQFGRPIGKFQAVQQQMAVMAEEVASAAMAARIGLSGDRIDLSRAALAKCRVSEASHQVSAIAHAVHGAIGVTEEYDLQLFSRRLKQGQLAFGSESYWAKHLAERRLECLDLNGADFVREHLQSASSSD